MVAKFSSKDAKLSQNGCHQNIRCKNCHQMVTIRCQMVAIEAKLLSSKDTKLSLNGCEQTPIG